MNEVRIGISGWRYKGWRGTFYPEDLPQNKELEFASHQLSTIEINGSFYRLQRPAYYKSWYNQTPDGFSFSVKANRYITHVKMLNEVESPLIHFFSTGFLYLEEKLGPILWQFPPRMKFDKEKFEYFLSLLPHYVLEAAPDEKHKAPNKKLRYAVEIRNESFMVDDFFELLNKYNVAFVFSDSGGKWPYAEVVTADFIYVRLHGSEVLYSSGYSEEALKQWENKINKWKKNHDIFVYFDNDSKVHAPFDAQNLSRRVSNFVPERQLLFPENKAA